MRDRLLIANKPLLISLTIISIDAWCFAAEAGVGLRWWYNSHVVRSVFEV